MPTLRDFLEKINIKAESAWDAPLAPLTTFKVGGPAELLLAPETTGDFARILRAARREGIPCFILGGGANIVVADRGLRGIVIETRRLDAMGFMPGCAGGVAEVVDAPALLIAECGLSMDRLCEKALERGLSGLETFYGMPGSVGGAVYMNARCYEVEVADRLAWTEVFLPPADGRSASRFARLPLWAPDWSYKRSPFQSAGPAAGAAILRAAFRLVPGDRRAIEAVMREKKADREAKGHYRLPCAGSAFKNDRSLGRPTGKILDELGLRGRRLGGAMVSDWHANIFVNAGGATAMDIAALVDLARREARARLGVELESEIIFVGGT